MTRFFNIQSLCMSFLCGFLSLVSASLFAATLQVPDNLIISEVDDKSIEHGFLDTKSVFELAQGSHTIILRYKDVFEDLDFAEDRVVESKDFVVKFIVNDEKQLKLTTSEIKNLVHSQAFSKSPELTLKDEHNKQLEIELENVADYKLAKQVDIAVNTFASEQAIKKSKEPVSISNKVSTPKAVNSKQQTHNTLIQINSLSMLKYWWQNASTEEKNHFKQYMVLDK